MLMIIPSSALGLSLLLCVECAFNWDHLGGPPPESDESLAYSTCPTLEPTPRWAKRIKEFLKRNRPRHPVEMLFPENKTALAEQHKEIKANMTKDPSWAWRKFSELSDLKGTTINRIPPHLRNFTFPDMGIGTYDCSKTDEKFDEYLDKVTLETDYDKLKAKFDPYDLEHNKTIDWEEPTFDDEEFDQFVQERIGRLLSAVYSLLSVNANDRSVQDVVKTIDVLTRELFTRNKQLNTNRVFKHYFLDNVLVVSEQLKADGVISERFVKIIKRLVKQFRRLDLNQIESVLLNLVDHYETMLSLVNTLLVGRSVSKETIGESVESFVQTVVNPLMSWRDNGKHEINLGKLETLLKPVVETYDHSIEVNFIGGRKKKDILKSVQHHSGEEHKNKEVEGKHERANIKQINNIINIFINKPVRSYRKKRRSVTMVTTTYLPPWDPKAMPFPKIKIPGLSSESSFNPIDSFQIKKREAYERHMKRKMFLPNNNSQSSFIFETFEYDNPNKTRRSKIAREKNIQKMREEIARKKDMRKGNKTYEAIYEARRREHKERQLRKQQEINQQGTKQPETKQQETKKQTEKKQTEKKHEEKKDQHECKVEKQTEQVDEPKTKGWTLQDITNIESWFREADKFYSRLSQEQPSTTSKPGLTTTGGHDRKESFDESYERYKGRKERRRKHKELSRKRYESSEDRSRSCKHCERRRRRKHRKYASSDSDYTESESSRRERRRRRKYRYRSDSSDSSRRYRKYHSSESRYVSSEMSDDGRRNKQKRSYDETMATTTTTTEGTTITTTRRSTTTKRKSTKPLDDDVDAVDEPSMTVEDVPSAELTSWHYWKDWSLFYFIHPNISSNISFYNISTPNIWRTTWPWTTKKKRITKWRHPNVSWAPMSEDSDSRSSQDSYDWGSGQSWIRNNKRELKSVEHFVRDNLFSEINEAAARLQEMNTTYSFESKDQDFERSEVEEAWADFSARYRKDFRILKAKEAADAREYQKWSLSGGNYSTTTEFDWNIKITKNFTRRSFRKGGRDIVFDISGMPMDTVSLEQIEKNLDADYLWKYGKNRTKTSTIPTTLTSTTTSPTTITTSTTTTTTTTTPPPSTDAYQQKTGYWEEEGKSIVDSTVDRMTSKEQDDHLAHFENNFHEFDHGDHHIFGEPVKAQRKRRDAGNKNDAKTMIQQVLNDRMSLDDFYVHNKKPKMFYLHEMPQLPQSEIRKKELLLQSNLDGFLQDQQQAIRKSRNVPQRFRKAIGHRVKRAGPVEPEKEKKEPTFDLKDFNQGKHPDHPIFILSDQDRSKPEVYKKYNVSFINDKVHEYMDDMFEDLKLNHDTSEEEKRANSIYYRKYLEKRTTEFFRKLQAVLEGDDKRAIENFTYPPNYDFGSVSIRDPKKEPYLQQLKDEYWKEHTKSMEEFEREIKLAEEGKLCTKKLREEAEEHVRGLPDDSQ